MIFQKWVDKNQLKKKKKKISEYIAYSKDQFCFVKFVHAFIALVAMVYLTLDYSSMS